MGGGGRDLLHYSCNHLLPFTESYSTGLWALEPGRVGCVPGPVPPVVLRGSAQTYDFDQPPLLLSLFWFRAIPPCAIQTAEQSACAIGVWAGIEGRECKGANTSSRGLPQQ
ncbi:Hypothetical predicted protein [Xyrichtys novacula]|uniref:Uncharacterized protein n=1 Tax=Xyrichtys novacula TaxID=13765 RepID=A0AAV1GHA7_XYRNO|nr:Hypothetical predicted protein [Xyrichtys novacula]